MPARAPRQCSAGSCAMATGHRSRKPCLKPCRLRLAKQRHPLSAVTHSAACWHGVQQWLPPQTCSAYGTGTGAVTRQTMWPDDPRGRKQTGLRPHLCSQDGTGQLQSRQVANLPERPSTNATPAQRNHSSLDTGELQARLTAQGTTTACLSRPQPARPQPGQPNAMAAPSRGHQAGHSNTADAQHPPQAH